MAKPKLSSQKSEEELERSTILERRKQKNELKIVQTSAKVSNSSYLIDAFMANQSKKEETLTDKEQQSTEKPSASTSTMDPIKEFEQNLTPVGNVVSSSIS